MGRPSLADQGISSMKPEFITFTGIDDRVDLRKLCELSDKYPIEWGVLFGGRIGNNRYPTIGRIDIVTKLGLTISAHLCRDFAKLALDGQKVIDYDAFDRIQVNAIKYEFDQLNEFHQRTSKPIIYQHRSAEFPVDLPAGVYPLHDKSGGKGDVAKNPPIQTKDSIFVGYAGGMGPDNVDEINIRLTAHTYWLDMETHIRTDDWLDLDKCETVCRKIFGNSDI